MRKSIRLLPPITKLSVIIIGIVFTFLLSSCAGGGRPNDVINPPDQDSDIRSISNMTEVRAAHTATLLRDGKVLIAGGMRRERDFLDIAELYDPATERFTPTGRMTTERLGHGAILMDDGRVLLAGGLNEGGGVVASAEIYDPATGIFSRTNNMIKAREGASMVKLNNGQILIVGGIANRLGVAEAELYTPASGTFTLTGSLHIARGATVAARLPNGQVIVCGGTPNMIQVLAQTEIYDPSSGVFTLGNNMNSMRYKFAGNVLLNGSILLTGGAVHRDQRIGEQTAELFDPTTKQFTIVTNMNLGHYKHTTATLQDGRVFIAGGSNRVEVFDPNSRTFRLLRGDLGNEMFSNNSTALSNGKVLVTGGYFFSPQGGPPNPVSSAWLVNP